MNELGPLVTDAINVNVYYFYVFVLLCVHWVEYCIVLSCVCLSVCALVCVGFILPARTFCPASLS